MIKKVNVKLLFLTILFFLFSNTSLLAKTVTNHLKTDHFNPSISSHKDVSERIADIDLPFIKNENQTNEKVKYYARTFAGTVFISDDAITYSLLKKNKEGNKMGWTLKEKMLKTTAAKAEGLDPAVTKVNYLKGNKNKWHRNVQTFQGISYGEIYKNIHLALKASGNNIEKIFTVTEGGKPENIKVAIEGAKKLKLTAEGELKIVTEIGTIRMTRPMAYQEIDGTRIFIPVSYSIDNDQTAYGFHVKDYNKKYPLVIDPLLASTFIGGSGDNFLHEIAVDPDGNVIVAGHVWSSPDYPVTPGAYDPTYNADTDIVISKLDSSLSTLLASTFLGGDSVETFYSLLVDLNGDIYVSVGTSSSDYPVTPGTYDAGHGGLYISKLSSDLSDLVATTLLPGQRMALGPDGAIYVMGSISTPDDYPATPGAYDTSHNGERDIYVAKLDPSLSTLLAATYVGGNNSEYLSDMVISPAGHILIAGSTSSSDYPVTAGAYNTENSGSSYFISQLDSSLSSLLSSTFFVNGYSYNLTDIKADLDGNVFIAGTTHSQDFQTTPGAYDETWNGLEDAFISKFDPSLSALLASTFLGADQDEYASEMVIDSEGNIYLAGSTFSLDFPITPGAYNDQHNNYYMAHGSSPFPTDAFISKLDNDLTVLLASTFIGSRGEDGVGGIAIDTASNIYLTGMTYSKSYPVTAGAYDTTFESYIQGFVSKLSPDLMKPDTDNDGLFDDEDNCPLAANPLQEDDDHDGIGNACDTCMNGPGAKDYWMKALVRSGGGEVYSVLPTFASRDKQIHTGYIISGAENNPGDEYNTFEIWAIRTDLNGDVLWSKSYGSVVPNYSYFIDRYENHITQRFDLDGNANGFFLSSYDDNWKTLVIWIDEDGEAIWKQYVNGSCGPVYHAEHGAILVPQSSSGNPSVLAINGAGPAVRTVFYNDPMLGFDSLYPIEVFEPTSDNDYLLAGVTGFDDDIIIMKLHNSPWKKYYRSPEDMGQVMDRVTSVKETPDGGFIAAGYKFLQTDESEYVDYKIWVMKLDSSGEIMWQKEYSEPGITYMMFPSLVLNSDGGYAVSGFYINSENKSKLFLMGLDASGNILWQKGYPGPYDGTASAVNSSLVSLADGYLLAGFAFYYNYFSETVLLKLNKHGDIPGSDLTVETNMAAADGVLNIYFSANFISNNEGATVTLEELTEQDDPLIKKTLFRSLDSDGDDIADEYDNCLCADNPAQEDADNDTIGDACDADTIYGTVSGGTQANVSVTLYAVSCGTPQPQVSTVANAEGYYSFGSVGDGKYLVVPEDADYDFAPVSSWVDIPQTDIQPYDFTATPNP